MFKPFPTHSKEILILADQYEFILAKIPKLIDEDFNTTGLYFGCFLNPSNLYKDLSFETAGWDPCNDYFKDFVLGTNSIDSNIPSTIDDVYIEDIEEYIGFESKNESN